MAALLQPGTQDVILVLRATPNVVLSSPTIFLSGLVVLVPDARFRPAHYIYPMQEFPAELVHHVVTGLDPADDPSRLFVDQFKSDVPEPEGLDRLPHVVTGLDPSPDPGKVWRPDEVSASPEPEAQVSSHTTLSGLDPQPDPPKVFRHIRRLI